MCRDKRSKQIKPNKPSLIDFNDVPSAPITRAEFVLTNGKYIINRHTYSIEALRRVNHDSLENTRRLNAHRQSDYNYDLDKESLKSELVTTDKTELIH